MKKICLFTAHTPTTGGGAVILRSLISNLKDFSFEWKYIANNYVKGFEDGYLGKGFMGQSMFEDVSQSWLMLSDHNSKYINDIVNKLILIDCDMYWIVSHNEGLRIAIELKRLQKRPVHLTIHDDWEGALATRSFRYRFFKKIASKLTIKGLKIVDSFDVISKGMQQRYKQLSGLEGEICHRYLPANFIHNVDLSGITTTHIKIGHVGSLYDLKDFISFLSLIKEWSYSQKKTFSVDMWGCHLELSKIPSEVRGNVVIHGNLPETDVIPKLMECNFLYSMYPMDKELQIFAETSLPTKLTSYLQSGVPILGHTTPDSTLAEFLKTTGVGIIWNGVNENEGKEVINNIIALRLSMDKLQNAREKYFGEKNLETMTGFFKN